MRRFVLTVLLSLSLTHSSLAAVIGGYIHRGKASGRSVIVFVHGLGGGARATWTHPTSNKFWPDLVFADPNFEEPDIFVVDYVSSIRGGTSIEAIEDEIARFLDNNGVYDHDQIIFVGHSLGGVLVRSLVGNHARIERVKLMYLLAAPTGGSNIANLAMNLGIGGATVDALTSRGDGSYLSRLANAWTNNTKAQAIPVYCGAEGKASHVSKLSGAGPMETRGVQVVSPDSAFLLCNRRLVTHPQHDHTSIAKPHDESDSVHQAFRDAYLLR